MIVGLTSHCCSHPGLLCDGHSHPRDLHTGAACEALMFLPPKRSSGVFNAKLEQNVHLSGSKKPLRLDADAHRRHTKGPSSPHRQERPRHQNFRSENMQQPSVGCEEPHVAVVLQKVLGQLDCILLRRAALLALLCHHIHLQGARSFHQNCSLLLAPSFCSAVCLIESRTSEHLNLWIPGHKISMPSSCHQLTETLIHVQAIPPDH